MPGNMGPWGGARAGAGREPKGDQPMDAQIVVRLEAGDKARLEEAARKREITVSDMVRDFVLKGLKRLGIKK